MNTTRKYTFLNDEDISATTYALIQRIEGSILMAIRTLSVWVQRYRERKQLLELSDEILADIGMTRADAYKELDKPFWRD